MGVQNTAIIGEAGAGGSRREAVSAFDPRGRPSGSASRSMFRCFQQRIGSRRHGQNSGSTGTTNTESVSSLTAFCRHRTDAKDVGVKMTTAVRNLPAHEIIAEGSRSSLSTVRHGLELSKYPVAVLVFQDMEVKEHPGLLGRISRGMLTNGTCLLRARLFPH